MKGKGERASTEPNTYHYSKTKLKYQVAQIYSDEFVEKPGELLYNPSAQV